MTRSRTAITDIDYGWKFQGRTMRLCQDRSITIDDSTYQMEKALRQLSMEYFALDRCMQCGICSAACPNGLLKCDEPFSPRNFIQRARLGLLELSDDELWKCTHCGNCQIICPYEVSFLDVMTSLRHLVVEQGAGYVPPSIKSALASIASCGNPWKESAAARVNWLEKLNLHHETDSPEAVHIFLGCLAGYDPRARKTAETAMRLLNLSRTPFKVLPAQEVCCGDTARRVGGLSTFERVRQTNIDNFLKEGVKTIYALSPHCYESLHAFYGWGDKQRIAIVPFLSLLSQLLDKGRLPIVDFSAGKVTYHDPCFFSKHFNLVEEPRHVIRSFSGLDLVEMEHSGGKSLCCGGGGGGFWRDVKKGERLAEIRLEEALKSGAEVLVTSCPYCLSMLEDAKLGDDRYERLEIMDICELVWKGINS